MSESRIRRLSLSPLETYQSHHNLTYAEPYLTYLTGRIGPINSATTNNRLNTLSPEDPIYLIYKDRARNLQ